MSDGSAFEWLLLAIIKFSGGGGGGGEGGINILSTQLVFKKIQGFVGMKTEKKKAGVLGPEPFPISPSVTAVLRLPV